MAAFPSLVLTNAGIALQNKVQGGVTLELTNIQMGSGQLNGQPIGPMTQLIAQNATVPIQGGQAIGQNTYQVEGFFTNADLSAGFWWREIGIFANDPDNGEILYAYANAGDAGDYIPTVTDQRIEKYIYFSMALANATTVNVTIPQTDTYVLRSTIGQANGVAGLGENGAVPIEQGGTGATTTQAALAALGVLSALVTAAAYNPSGTYAVGDYCTYSGNLYVCNTAIPDGEPWTAEHWTETTVAAELSKKSNGFVGNAQSLGYTKIADITENGTYLIFDGPSFLSDYPEQLSKDGLNYGLLRVTDGESYKTYEIIAGNAPATKFGFAFGFLNVNVIAWTRVADTMPPQKVQLPLEDGFSSNGVHENYFCKTQENIVHVSFCFMKGEGDIQVGEVVATLPVGCRPAVETARSVGADGIDFDTGIFSAEIHIRTNGEIFLWGINAKAKWLYGEFFLLAEN